MAEKKKWGCLKLGLMVVGGLFAFAIILAVLLSPEEPTVTATERYQEPDPEPKPPPSLHPLAEPDAIIADSMTEAVIDDLIRLVRGAGYRCDSVSAASHAVFTAGRFTLSCNEFRYEYLIEDRGGNWVVTVE